MCPYNEDEASMIKKFSIAAVVLLVVAIACYPAWVSAVDWVFYIDPPPQEAGVTISGTVFLCGTKIGNRGAIVYYEGCEHWAYHSGSVLADQFGHYAIEVPRGWSGRAWVKGCGDTSAD